MFCPKCGQANPEGARFCVHCSAGISFACATCGADVPTDARYCIRCGAPAGQLGVPASYLPRQFADRIRAISRSVEGERKQLTVVFCDIVGYSALAAKLGPERIHQLINRFSKVALAATVRYEGTINQFLGDGFMALFGAPIAHEDHARRAGLASIEIRDRAEVPVRIGLNSGFVVLGPIGEDLWIDFMAFGDTVIHAARLQAAAEPGQILMSEESASMVTGYITTVAAPQVQVKERTLNPMRVVGIGPRTSRLDLPDQSLTPFVGRDREIAILADALASASNGSAQIVSLVGEPGIGKSRVVFEFAREAAAAATVIEGRCVSFGGRFAYLPLLDILRRMCDLSVADSHENVEAKLRRTLTQLGLDQQYVPFLLNALNVPLRQSEIEHLDRPTLKGQTFRALRELFIASARRRPLTLIIEDLHWIDPTSAEFLALFTDDIQGAPVLIVATFRPGYQQPWTDKTYARLEALQPLDTTTSEQFVRAIVGVDGPFISEIVARGEGNPFFLEELARSVKDKMAEVMPSVPRDVHDVLAARIDRLDEESKRVLLLAAVIGREFTLELVDAVWDGPDEPVRHLQELRRLDFIRERQEAEQRTFMFKHALTQEVAYEGLLEARRQELHGSVGQALERIYGDRADEHVELLAHHFQRSADTERAIHYLLLANRHADRRNALDEAYEYYRAARELLEALPDSEANRRQLATLFVEQTREYHFRFRNQEYYDILTSHESMIQSLGDESLLGAFYGQLGHRELAMFFDYRRTERILEQALELCERSGNDRDALFAESCLVWPATYLSEYDRALAHREKARQRLETHYESFPVCVSHGGAILLRVDRGEWAMALSEADAAIAIGRQRSDTTIISFNNFMKSYAQAEQGDWAGALESGRAALAAAPTEYFRGFAQLTIAHALCHTGQAELGLPTEAAIIDMLDRVLHKLGWIKFAPGLVEDLIAAGARDDAISLLDRIEEAAKVGPAPIYLGKCRRLRAELGQLSAAELRAGLDGLRRIGAQNELALSLATLGRLEHQADNLDAATGATQEALAIFERLGTLGQPQRARSFLEGLPENIAR